MLDKHLKATHHFLGVGLGKMTTLVNAHTQGEPRRQSTWIQVSTAIIFTGIWWGSIYMVVYCRDTVDRNIPELPGNLGFIITFWSAFPVGNWVLTDSCWLDLLHLSRFCVRTPFPISGSAVQIRRIPAQRDCDRNAGWRWHFGFVGEDYRKIGVRFRIPLEYSTWVIRTTSVYQFIQSPLVRLSLWNDQVLVAVNDHSKWVNDQLMERGVQCP